MTVLQAALIALYYGFYSAKPLILFIGPNVFGSIVGLFLGIIMGNPSMGVAVGAAIHTMYLGVVMYGGTLPSDQLLACCIAVPLAISAGLDTETAVALAAPFGAVGVGFQTIWMTINTSVWSPYIDKCCEKNNYLGIRLGAFVYPVLTSIVLRSPIIFLILFKGTDAVVWLVNNLPQTILHGFEIMGKILPAMGFGIFLYIMGSPIQIPFFIAGFFAMKCFNLPIIAQAVFGFILAYLSLVWGDPDFLKKGDR